MVGMPLWRWAVGQGGVEMVMLGQGGSDTGGGVVHVNGHWSSWSGLLTKGGKPY